MTSRHQHAIRAFFGPRAEDWERMTVRDIAQIERTVTDCAHRHGSTVLDLGCGTGRAVPALRRAVGPEGCVIAIDVTPEMVRVGRAADGRGALAQFIVADVHRLPVASESVDAIHAQGILPHLADPAAALRDWRRVTRCGGRLAVFHAIGRVQLAAIHQSTPSDDDVLADGRLRRLLADSGWVVDSIEDATDRFLALARRGD